jgi:hypothetical protein
VQGGKAEHEDDYLMKRILDANSGSCKGKQVGSDNVLPPVDFKEGSYMYVPPFDSLLKAIGLTRAEFEESTEVAVPRELLKLLLQVAVASSDFNEAGYLRNNPDIAAAIRSGKVDAARLHYVGFGYFESRTGATPEVDEAWYLRIYPDVADAVANGAVASAAEHFQVIGASEGRSPNASYVPAAEQWKKAIAQPGKHDEMGATGRYAA